MTTTYQQNAIEILNKIGAKIKIEFITMSCPEWDIKNGERNEYSITLTNRIGNDYTFQFWDSINATQKNTKPTAYDVLACLQYSTPETFKDFCDDYGYDMDSIKALKTFKACKSQTDQLKSLFNNEEIELLQEIN